MRRQLWKGSVTLLFAAASVVAAPVVAVAAAPSSLLADGVSLGEVAGVHGETKPVGDEGACATESDPEGYGHAAVYRVTASAASLLRLSVADDLDDSLSLCLVAVYESDGSDALPSSAPVAATEGCADASECAVDHWLTNGTTYDVVLWATPPESQPGPEDAAFSFDASVKLPASLTTTLYGHRLRNVCTGVHEVRYLMPYTIRSTASSGVTGTVVMRFDKKVSPSVYQPYTTFNVPLSAGVGQLTRKAGPSGVFRITTTLAETPTRLGVTRTVYVAYITPKWKRYADGGLRLKVPWYHQQLRLSCESATLRMAHNYFKPGHIDSDWDVLKVIGVDDRPKKGNRWGNPNKTFVGKPNGKMMKTGYGVHYAPIAHASTKFSPCRPPVVLKKPSRATIARYVSMGFPVIVWGAHSGATGIYKKVWKAWDGKWITAWSVEHVWVVVGFHGKPWKPTSFIVHDPSGGANRKVSLKAFDNFTKYFKRAVVVRG